jgi:Sodium:neurotransmitter symporter family
MFVGVEILNENNYGSKGQNEANLSVPEIQVSLMPIVKSSPKTNARSPLIQMSLIKNEETIVKVNGEVIKTQLKIKAKQEPVFVAKDKWGKDIEFLLSCIALSVGLGNVWRFPFTALGRNKVINEPLELTPIIFRFFICI